jgi:hypothetical protein
MLQQGAMNNKVTGLLSSLDFIIMSNLPSKLAIIG